MKVMISSDNKFAHYYIRQGFARVFECMGWDTVLWDINKKSAFDAFDEFEPDIFIGQTYNVNDAIIKCIKERPYMYTFFKASDWGVASENMDLEKYPVLVANEKEIAMMNKMKDETGIPTSLFIHYSEYRLSDTHGHWKENGFVVNSLLNAADVLTFTRGKHRKEFACDIGFVGGRWGYKAQTIDKWLLPMMHPNIDLNIKLFGNQGWGVPQYCGFIEDDDVKNFFASCTICPNISEPHSQDFGYDIIERPFKLLANKCFVISDSVEDLQRLIPKGIVYAKEPEEFMRSIKYFLENPEKRNEYIEAGYKDVVNNHTYFHRWAEMFTNVGQEERGKEILVKYDEIKERLEL